jgi:hypothetical protein
MEAVFAVGIVGLFAFWVGQLKHEISAMTTNGMPHNSQPTVHRIIAEPSHEAPREVAPHAGYHVARSNAAHAQESRMRRVGASGIPTWTIE